ncbi:UNVERIFIED_CONTAM: hypothetical protein HHA_203880 [Hammondia hammondi]|eukprot:XP_008884669.1 hypothetical protein HHA_203880 [Hammondia hammondi]
MLPSRSASVEAARNALLGKTEEGEAPIRCSLRRVGSCVEDALETEEVDDFLRSKPPVEQPNLGCLITGMLGDKIQENRRESLYTGCERTESSCSLSLVQHQCRRVWHKEEYSNPSNSESEERTSCPFPAGYNVSNFGPVSKDEDQHRRRDEKREDMHVAEEDQRGRAGNLRFSSGRCERECPLSAVQPGPLMSYLEAEGETIKYVEDIGTNEGCGLLTIDQGNQERGVCAPVSRKDGLEFLAATGWLCHDGRDGKEDKRDEDASRRTDGRGVAQSKEDEKRLETSAHHVLRQATPEVTKTRNKEWTAEGEDNPLKRTRNHGDLPQNTETSGSRGLSTGTEKWHNIQDQRLRQNEDKASRSSDKGCVESCKRETRPSLGANVCGQKEGDTGASARETQTGEAGGNPAFVSSGDNVYVNCSDPERQERRQEEALEEESGDGDEQERHGHGGNEQPDSRREDGQRNGLVQRKRREGTERGKTEHVCLTRRSGTRLQMSGQRKTGSRVHDIYSAISSAVAHHPTASLAAAGRGELPPPPRQAFSRDLGGAPIHCSSLFRSCAGGGRKIVNEGECVPDPRARPFRCFPHLSCLHRPPKEAAVRFRQSGGEEGQSGCTPWPSAPCCASASASADSSFSAGLLPSSRSASPSQLPENGAVNLWGEAGRFPARSCVFDDGSEGQQASGSLLLPSSSPQEKARNSMRYVPKKSPPPVDVATPSSNPHAASSVVSKDGETSVGVTNGEACYNSVTHKHEVGGRRLSESARSQHMPSSASIGGIHLKPPALLLSRQVREAKSASDETGKPQILEERETIAPTQTLHESRVTDVVSSALVTSSFDFSSPSMLTPAATPNRQPLKLDADVQTGNSPCSLSRFLKDEHSGARSPVSSVGFCVPVPQVVRETRDIEDSRTETGGKPATVPKEQLGSGHSGRVPQSEGGLGGCVTLPGDGSARSASEAWTTASSRRERRTLMIGSPAFAPDEEEEPDDERDVLLDLLHFTSKRRFLMDEAEAIAHARLSLRKMKRELPFLMRKILEERRTKNERDEAKCRFLRESSLRMKGTENKAERRTTVLRPLDKEGKRDAPSVRATTLQSASGSCSQSVSPEYSKAAEHDGITEMNGSKERIVPPISAYPRWPDADVDTPMQPKLKGQDGGEGNTGGRWFDRGDWRRSVSVPCDSFSSVPRICSSRSSFSPRLPPPCSSTYSSLLSLGERARIPKQRTRIVQDDRVIDKTPNREIQLRRAFCSLLVGYGRWEAAHSLSVDEVEDVLCFALPSLSRREISDFLSANLPNPPPRTVTPADLQLASLLPSLFAIKDGEFRAAREENEAETVLVEERLRSTCAIFRQRFIKMLSWRLNYENILSLHVNFTDFSDLCRSRSPVFTAACFHLMRQESSKLAWPVVEALSTYEVLYAAWYVAQRVLHADGVCPQRLLCHPHYRRPSAKEGILACHLRRFGFRSLTVCCWNSRAKTREETAGQPESDLPISYKLFKRSKPDTPDTPLTRWRFNRALPKVFGQPEKAENRGTRVATSCTLLQIDGVRGSDARHASTESAIGRGSMWWAAHGAKGASGRKEAEGSAGAGFVSSQQACSKNRAHPSETIPQCDSDPGCSAELFPSAELREGQEQEILTGGRQRESIGRGGRHEDEEASGMERVESFGDMRLSSRRRKDVIGKLEIDGVDGCSCCALELLAQLDVDELLSLLDQKRLKVLADAGLADEAEGEGGDAQEGVTYGGDDRRTESIARSREYNTDLVRLVAECVEHLRQSGNFCLYPHSSHKNFL